MSSNDDHILLSGGSRGLGRTLVDGLLEAGYRVSTFARDPGDLPQRAEQEPRLHAGAADLRDPGSLSAFLNAAEERFGPPSGLVNCAGVAMDHLLATMREDAIDAMIQTNLAGTIRLTRLVVRRMIPRRRGSIVNISSIVGIRGYRGLAVYSATKAALDGMTRALARELGDWKIRINSVAPGYLNTEMTGTLTETQQGQILRRTPLGRLGTPRDVVGPVKFLLSEESAFITGQVLVVDGGITA
jgi:3-oxoacyl-[acyl-carrier protein] reductase